MTDLKCHGTTQAECPPEKFLYMNVLLQAFRDLSAPDAGGLRTQEAEAAKQGARSFFLKDHVGVDAVCAMAGVNASLVRKKAREVIDYLDKNPGARLVFDFGVSLKE